MTRSASALARPREPGTFVRMTGSRVVAERLDTAVAAALPAAARVLDIGCGDGSLVDRLADLGFDALGVDPAAPARPRLVREPVEHVRDLGAFDAVTAVMALHHAQLDAVTSAVSTLLRPHGRLFVYDFDWQAHDDRAAAWLARHDSPGETTPLTGWQREHGNLHRDHEGGADPRISSRCLKPAAPTSPGVKRHDLETEERALIDIQALPALGFWITAGAPSGVSGSPRQQQAAARAPALN